MSQSFKFTNEFSIFVSSFHIEQGSELNMICQVGFANPSFFKINNKLKSKDLHNLFIFFVPLQRNQDANRRFGINTTIILNLNNYL